MLILCGADLGVPDGCIQRTGLGREGSSGAFLCCISPTCPAPRAIVAGSWPTVSRDAKTSHSQRPSRTKRIVSSVGRVELPRTTKTDWCLHLVSSVPGTGADERARLRCALCAISCRLRRSSFGRSSSEGTPTDWKGIMSDTSKLERVFKFSGVSSTLQHGAPNGIEGQCGTLAKINRHGYTIWCAAPKNVARLQAEY